MRLWLGRRVLALCAPGPRVCTPRGIQCCSDRPGTSYRLRSDLGTVGTLREGEARAKIRAAKEAARFVLEALTYRRQM